MKGLKKPFFIVLMSLMWLSSCAQGNASETHEQKVQRLEQIQSTEDLYYLDHDEIEYDIDFNELTIESLEDVDIDKFDDNDVNEVNRTLTIGDSWGFFSCIYGGMRKALNAVSSKMTNDRRCIVTTKNGVQAHQWLDTKQHKRVLKILKKDKKVKQLYIFLGGNDMMGKWVKNITPQDELKLLQTIFKNVSDVVEVYKKERPDLRIVVSGYDYPHFRNKQLIPLYNKIYARMLKPTHEEINNGLIRFTNYFTKLDQPNRQVYYIHHLGMSQYYDGFPNGGVKPYSTLHPNYISARGQLSTFGGNPKYPSSLDSMINWLGIEKDSFHLSSRNYYLLMLHSYNNLMYLFDK